MNGEINELLGFFRHIFPDFSANHVLVYRLLWKVEPKSGEEIIMEAGLAHATVYKMLSELIGAGLVKKTSCKPLRYYAENPIRCCSQCVKRTHAKLGKGMERVREILSGSQSADGEIYVIRGENGFPKLIDKKTRIEIRDEQELHELRRAVETSLHEIGQQKMKAWALYR